MVDTLKTSVVVVLLLAGLYCVYVVLNKPDQSPQELAWETGAADPALQMPALMIIGEVVELADSLNWFDPLTAQQKTDLDSVAKAL